MIFLWHFQTSKIVDLGYEILFIKMNRYKIIGHIGEGAHGYVVKAINLESRKEVALKKLLLKSLSEGIPTNILREIKALQHIDCQYVRRIII